MIGFFIFIAWVITMAFVGYYSNPAAGIAGNSGPATAGIQTVSSSPGDPSAQILTAAKRGSQLVNSLGCIACHRVNGQGGTLGPELTGAILKGKSRPWLITQIRNPKAHFPNSIMPAFSSLTNQQVNEVVDFLLSLTQREKQLSLGSAVPGRPVSPHPVAPSGPSRVAVTGPQGPPGPASFVIGNVELGEYLFKQNCEQCHGVGGKDKVPNPGSTDGTVPPLNPIDSTLSNKNAQTFINNIDPYIQHGSIPAGLNPVLHMLPFGDSKSLTQQMITNVEAYVLHLNGVDRAQLVHPGLHPHLFFWLVVIVFGLVLGGFSIWKGRR
jgi:sulfur oxidation c-type cytochrome SoxX